MAYVASLRGERGVIGAVASLWTVTVIMGLVVAILAHVASWWSSMAGLCCKAIGLVRPPGPAPAGSTAAEVPEALALQQAYRAATGPCAPVHGGHLLVTRLDVIHRVCQDHRLFPNRGLPKDERANPLSAHLFSLEDERWRVVRTAMSPAFTPAKVKAMFPLHATQKLQDTLRSAIGMGSFADVDIKELMERFVTDDVGSALFGVECGALERPGNPFHAHCAEAFNNSAWRRLRQRLLNAWPSLAVHIPYRSSTATFFQNIVKQLRTARQSKLRSAHANLLGIMFKGEDGTGAGNAAQSRLLRAVEAPQMFATFRAGFEATAPTLAFALLELAHNQDVQLRLQEELDGLAVRCGAETPLDAQSLDALEYLDSVVKETLRKYPPNATLIRRTAARCLLPGTEGDEATTVEEGTRLVVPVYAVHHDPEHFPEPERFDPERFRSGRVPDSTCGETAAPANLKAYLPFGLGRRHCVARRFALQEVKVGLAAVLQQFHVCPCDATPTLPPPFLAGRSIVLALEGDCTLRVATRPHFGSVEHPSPHYEI